MRGETEKIHENTVICEFTSNLQLIIKQMLKVFAFPALSELNVKRLLRQTSNKGARWPLLYDPWSGATEYSRLPLY